MANTVNFRRSDYETALVQWQQVNDCDDGQQAITLKGDEYLPRPNPTDKSDQNQARYQAYLDRALFTNFIQPTLTGLVGEVYCVDPIAEMPPSIALIEDDVDDTGVTLDQQSKKVVRNVLKFGRAALFVDFPDMVKPETGEVEQTSKADLEKGNVRASIICYNPMSIINWSVEKVGNSNKLTLIVIEEKALETDPGDPFKKVEITQWRVLKLEEGVYMREIWRKKSQADTDGEDFQIVDGSEATPTMANGSLWDEIPFTFVGSNNNDADIDRAPVYDLSVVNLGHYRNSAEFEDSTHFVGQPMYGVDIGEMSIEDYKTLHPVGIQVGSKAVLHTRGGSVSMVQPDPNTMALTGMQEKEKQMVALGARIVQDAVQKTATASNINRTTETSTLSNVANNTGAAYSKAFIWAQMYSDRTEPNPEKATYALNNDFKAASSDPLFLQKVQDLWFAGLLTEGEARESLTKAGVAFEDLETWKDLVADNPAGLPAGTEPEGGLNDGS